MHDLLTWLKSQHHGLRTYKAFKQKVLDLAESDRENRALYRLLSSIVDRYIEMYDGELTPTEIADSAFERLIRLVTEAEGITRAPATRRVEIMNELATAELF